uniref:histidine kinase n=1 Tax=Magnetococcus massalia (strain MO-1) TaxID=451514 RepID=A0A1S7LEZ1_MAGMO|nr:putative histidine kinase with response regulator receiver domain [Candidatus Magnetococcus massalia]
MKARLNPLHMSIGARIFLGFGIILALLIILGVVGNFGVDSAARNFADYGESNQQVREVLALERNVLDLQRGVLAYTYSGYEGLAERVRDLQKVLSQQMVEARSQVVDPERAKILEQMDAHFKLYAGNFDAAVEERHLRDEMAFKQLENSGDQALELLEKIHREMQFKGDEQGSALVNLSRMQLVLVQRDALRFLTRPNARLVRDTKKRLNDLSSALERLVKHWRGGDPQVAQQLKDLSGQFQQAFNGMVQATRAYMHLVYVVMGGEAAQIGYLAKKLKEISLKEQGLVEQDMSRAVLDTERMIEVVSLITILLGLFLAWKTSRGISSPIRAMTHSLTNLARGRRNVEIPGKGRSDEIGAMAMAADVFKEKADELANASRYKSEFLANMSHELRTPLNSLLILSKVLSYNEARNLTQDQVESAEVIHESGSDLLRLINDILDLSKVEAGRMEVVVEERPFATLQHTIKRLFQPIAMERNLVFDVSLDPTLPAVMVTDWAKMEQILRNFLSNAVKFTERGYVKVHIAPTHRGQLFMNPELDPGRSIAFSVEDSGIGIPHNKQSQVFEAFRQADGTTSRKYGGTGLGLSICRKFADLIGGEIQLQSEEGRGATFTLFLPVKMPKALITATVTDGIVDAPEMENKQQDIVHFEDQSRVVLVVDDDRRNVFALKKMLHGRVGRVLSGSNGLQALDVLNEHPDVDLVFMDIMMPEMDGYQAMEEIRRQIRFRHLPIIALTAKAMPGDRERCLSAGASDYLAKPVEADTLLRALSDWMSKPKIASASHEPVIHKGQEVLPKVRILADGNLEKSLDQLKEINLGQGQSITVLVVDDDMRNTFSLAHALQKLVDRVLMARDGRNALSELRKEPDVDLVIMDIMMPHMDGLEAIRQMRQEPGMDTIPVIALSAKSLFEDQQVCMDAGANAFMGKPVDLQQLVECMATLLNQASQDKISPSPDIS